MRIHINVIFSKTKQFRAIVSILTTYRKSYVLFTEPIIGPIKFKMAEIRRLEYLRFGLVVTRWLRST